MAGSQNSQSRDEDVILDAWFRRQNTRAPLGDYVDIPFLKMEYSVLGRYTPRATQWVECHNENIKYGVSSPQIRTVACFCICIQYSCDVEG
jgi:hypothetical protein